MSLNPRLFSGDVASAPSGFVQFPHLWSYYATEDGNFILSTNPTASATGSRVVDVKTEGGDRLANVK